MAKCPVNNFDARICAQFERFLRGIEALDPPSADWIKAQRQPPKTLWNEWSLEQISASQEAYRLRMLGRALQHLKGDRGLYLPDGWKNDFAFNFDIVQRQVVDLFELGTWPASGYSDRIGILLRLANRRDLSDRFHAAWSRIFIRV